MIEFIFTLRRFPFDTQNSIGYLIAIVIECILIWNVLLIAACTSSVTVGGALALIQLSNDMKETLNSFTLRAKLRKNRLRSLEQLSEFIELHSNSAQLS